jgi:hypothetical protein
MPSNAMTPPNAKARELAERFVTEMLPSSTAYMQANKEYLIDVLTQEITALMEPAQGMSEEEMDDAAVEIVNMAREQNWKNGGTLVNDASAVHRAIIDLAHRFAGSGWRPIETAPKDGTSIFIYRTGWTQAVLAKWDEYPGNPVLGENEAGNEIEGNMYGWLIEDELFCAGNEDGFLGWSDDQMPSHWMPNLPTPPAKENDE